MGFPAVKVTSAVGVGSGQIGARLVERAVIRTGGGARARLQCGGIGGAGSRGWQG